MKRPPVEVVTAVFNLAVIVVLIGAVLGGLVWLIAWIMR